jgi:malonyl-CoA O-methyltransferase
MMFTSFGPDTLQTFREPLQDYILPDFIDMHHQGDALIKARCVDPVMDVEYLSLQYQDAESCLKECLATGLLLDSENLLEKLYPLKNAAGKWLLPFEIVYGHAAGTAHLYEESPDADGVVSFPLSHLRRQARRSM